MVETGESGPHTIDRLKPLRVFNKRPMTRGERARESNTILNRHANHVLQKNFFFFYYASPVFFVKNQGFIKKKEDFKDNETDLIRR